MGHQIFRSNFAFTKSLWSHKNEDLHTIAVKTSCHLQCSLKKLSMTYANSRYAVILFAVVYLFTGLFSRRVPYDLSVLDWLPLELLHANRQQV